MAVAMSTFRLTRNGVALVEQPLDGGQAIETPPQVSELQPVGFEVVDAEPDVEYLVTIGDLDTDPPRAETHFGTDVGRRQRTTVFWEDKLWFESARGFVLTHLYSRSLTELGEWHERCSARIYVLPSKLGESRYRALTSALAGLASGLNFDLIGKATRGIGEGAIGTLPPRLPHLELNAIDAAWREIGLGLRAIQQNPVLRIGRRSELSSCWGGERISSVSVGRLAAQGIDPRLASTQRPFTAVRERLEQSVDTTEHRGIAGLLELIGARLADCRMSLEDNVRALESDRAFRDQSPDGSSPSLYETYDLPRLERLARLNARASDIAGELRAARRGALLHGVVAAPLRLTPVFSNVEPYRRVYRAAQRYLKSSPLIIDTGDELRVKATSRLYEQWVFLQICGAFRVAGLSGESLEQVVTRVERSRRYLLDLQRGTTVTYRAFGERLVRIRYEPYVFGRILASRNRDTIYRGVKGDTPWSPDILVEVLRGPEPLRVEYAVVVDAKYARSVTSRHWEGANKYRQIRATADDRQVVKQLWLAFPGLPEAIMPLDPAVTWTTTGPDRPLDEAVDGVLAMTPPDCDSLDDEDALASEGAVSPVAQQFVNGLLAFLGLVDPAFDSTTAER